PAANPASLPSATTTASYSGSIVATGGVSGYTWTVNGTNVPTNNTPVALSLGLSASNNGSATLTITGTPTGVGTVSIAASINASNGSTFFRGTLGYTVSGTASYAGSKTGRIYLSLPTTNCGGGGSPGTSISGPGAFTIRGVPPGAYTLQAFVDAMSTQSLNASD